MAWSPLITGFQSLRSLFLPLVHTGASDLVDRMAVHGTIAGMMLCATAVGISQLVMSPIKCIIRPQDGVRGYDSYVENYCWMEGTYYIPMNETFPKKETVLGTGKYPHLNFYQWMPLLFLLQALIAYLPYLIWVAMHTGAMGTSLIIGLFAAPGSSSGLPLKTIVRDAMAAAASKSTTEADKHLEFVAASLHRALSLNRSMRPKPTRDLLCGVGEALLRIQTWFARYIPIPCLCVARTLGNYLTTCYLLFKLTLLIVFIVQINLLSKFAHLNNAFYGWTILSDLMNGTEWDDTGSFPRMTVCYYRHREEHETTYKVSQCVLPANFLLEKIFIILWFWFVGLMLADVYSAFSWGAALLPSWIRRRYVRKYLRLAADSAKEILDPPVQIPPFVLAMMRGRTDTLQETSFGGAYIRRSKNPYISAQEPPSTGSTINHSPANEMANIPVFPTPDAASATISKGCTNDNLLREGKKSQNFANEEDPSCVKATTILPLDLIKSKKLRNWFAERYMCADGVLVLRLIASNAASEWCVARLVAFLFRRFLEQAVTIIPNSDMEHMLFPYEHDGGGVEKDYSGKRGNSWGSGLGLKHSMKNNRPRSRDRHAVLQMDWDPNSGERTHRFAAGSVSGTFPRGNVAS